MNESKFSCVLPEDLIFDILSRLTIKSLLKFRCVCKSWNTLTRDPVFAMKQLSMASSSSSLTTGTADNTFVILAHPQLSLVYNKITSPVRSPFRSDQNIGRARLYGPCNGIVCLYDIEASRFAVWNPATGESKAVPIRNPYDAFYKLSKVKNGFGYDPVRDDYKLFVITQGFITKNIRDSFYKNMYVGTVDVAMDEKSSEGVFAQRVEIYSLNSDEWKFLETNKKINIDSPNWWWRRPGHYYAYLNGFCYWLGCTEKRGDQNGDGYSYSNITSFDMNIEEFGEIEIPEDVRHNDKRLDYVQLVVVKERLCLIWQEPCLLNLRVLVNKRWMKLPKVITLAFVNYTAYAYSRNRETYEVLMVRDNGEIVLQNRCDRRLQLYNPSTCKLTHLVFDVSVCIDEIVYCKGSLVPLNGRALRVS